MLIEEVSCRLGDVGGGGMGDEFSSLRLKAVLRLSLKGLPLPVPENQNTSGKI